MSAYIGASGFSYPTWKPAFYPADAKPDEFLARYATRLPSVELNTTGYRLPAESSFVRWRDQTPPAFRFAVKLPGHFTRQLATFEERISLLEQRLGVVRVTVIAARDEGFLTLLLGSLDPSIRLAFDFRHDSWDGVALERVVRVDEWDADASFRYVRFRDPPYTEQELERAAERIAPLLDQGVDVFAYFRHEDEPTAPLYAERLLALLGNPHP